MKNTFSLVSIAVLFGGLLSLPFIGSCNKPVDDGRLVPDAIAHPTTPDEVEALNAETIQTGEPKNFGYLPDEEGTKEFLQSLPGGKQTLQEQAPELFEGGNGEAVFLYRALNLAYEQKYPGSKWKPHAQGIGDCVSHGWALGCDIHLSILARIQYLPSWPGESATESIYGGSRVEARGRTFAGYSDGSYGGSAAKWVSKWGLVFRQPYSDPVVDLSKYSAGRAKEWGAYGNGGQGDNGKLDEIARQKPIKRVALVTSFKELAAAIQNGYPVPVCSGYGFTSSRDKDGFARQSGSWAHCMCFVAVRFDRPGALCQNSWGSSWINGPVWPSDQPAGSFWVDAATVDRMLSGRDSFAVSGFADGFRRLRHTKGWDGAMLEVPTNTVAFSDN